MQTEPRRPWGIAAIALVVILAAAFGGYALLVPGATPSTRPASRDTVQEDARTEVRQLLAKPVDQAGAHTVLQQVNIYLGQHPDVRLAGPSAEQRALLAKKQPFGLDADELIELDSGTFTLLDGQHLEACMLYGDVLHSLGLDGLSPAEQAAAAFAWVVRQVRLQERNEELVPPQFVLHRGWGTSAERSVILLGLLEQLGIPGCAVVALGDDGQPTRLWAVGALIAPPMGKAEVVLFDPRLGLPLPGPLGDEGSDLARAWRLGSPLSGAPGQTIATLSMLRQKPDLLKALDVDEKHHYDVTAEQVRTSQLFVNVPLSAMAPRWHWFEEEVLRPAGPPIGKVHLSQDPAQVLQTWKETASQLGDPVPEVSVWQPATRIQRRFWTAEEGGIDKTQRYRKSQVEMIPQDIMPAQLNKLGDRSRDRLREFLFRPFVELPFEAGRPRDQILRGAFDEAAEQLVRSRSRMEDEKGRMSNTYQLDKKIDEFCNQIITPQAELQRAEQAASRLKDAASQAALEEARNRVEDVWKESQENLVILLQGVAASTRIPETAYQLALCKHEQAERLLLRVERLQRAGAVPADLLKDLKNAWNDAVFQWGLHAGEAADASGARRRLGDPTATARTLRARARQQLGDAEATKPLLDDLPETTEQERLAHLYLAKQAKPK